MRPTRVSHYCCVVIVDKLVMAVLSPLLLGLASDDEERLFIDLFRGYQPLVRPVRSINDSAIVVQMGLQLVLLISIVSDIKL